MKKLLTFLTLLTLSIGVTWAADETITFSDLYNSNTTLDGVTINGTDFSLVFQKRDGGTATQYYTNGYAVRWYGGGTLTVSSSTKTITKIEITFTQTANSISANVGSYSLANSVGTWQGSASSIVLTQSGTSGHCRISSIAVTYAGSTPQPTTYSITGIGDVTGGSVTASATSNISEGTSITITATPSTGYELSNLTVDGNDVTSSVNSNNQYTFSMPAHDVAVSATFIEQSTPQPSNYFFYESFNNSNGLGGNDGSWSGGLTNTALSTDIPDNSGWSFTNGYPAKNCVRFGSSSKKGVATSPTLNVNSGNIYTLTFKAGAWDGSSESTTLKIDATSSSNDVDIIYSDPACTIPISSVTMTKGAWTTFTVYVKPTSSQIRLIWEGNAKSNSRFFLDEVGIVAPASAAHTISVTQPEEGGTISTNVATADAGDVITVTATPATGYELTALAYNGTAIDITSTPYTFTMPDADVTLTATFTAINYNIYRTITAQNPNDQGGWIGNWNENCNLPDGAQGTDYVVTSTYGKEVQFKVGNNEGYKILAENVTAKDANNNNVPLTVVSSDNSGIVFKFNMPASNVTISAYFTFYQPDLYLMGTANDQNWEQTYKMTYSNDQYTIRAYFAGQSASDPYGYFQFEGDGTRYASGAEGEYWPISENGTGESHFGDQVPLYANSSKNFRVPAGIYDIVINKDRNKVTVNPVAVNITFSPAAGSVYQGTTVTATSNLYTLLHAINSNVTESSVTNEVSLDGTTFSSSVALNNTGSATVTGKATYGYIAPTATAAYTVTEFPSEGRYELVTSEDQLINGGEYVILNHANPSVEGYAMSTTQNSNNRGETALIPIVNNKVIPTEDTQIVTLETASDGWHLKVGDNSYLYAVSGNNYLRTGSNDNNSDDYVAKISIGESSYIATIQFQTETKRYLRRNDNSKIFSCYTSGQQEVYLYKKATSITRVETPTFDPEAGTYYETQNVTIACATDGATIYYTLDGSEPTSSSDVYTQAIPVSSTTTIKAIAMKDGMNPSNMATATYTIKVATPTFTPEAGTYGEGQNITINCATSGASIYYTTDETDPTTASTLYDGTAISVTETTTIKAIAVKDGLDDSEIATATYTIVLPCTIPFVETWDNNTHGSGANSPDDSEPAAWSGQIASGKTSYDDNAGWEYEELGVGYQCIKLGTGKNGGSATTPVILVNNNTVYKMTFRAGGWGSDDTHMTLSATGATIYSDEDCTEEITGYDLSNSAWTTYTVYVKTSATSMTITWSSSIGNDRFFLDDVNIPKPEPVDEPTSVTLAELCATGVTTEGENWYVITDKLKAVYADTDRGIIWCKDLGNQSINPTSIHEGDQIDFLLNDPQAQNGRDWDQSNWILLQFTTPTGSSGIDEMLRDAQNKFIKPSTIKGKLIDNKNYIFKMDDDVLHLVTPADEGYSEEPYEYNVYCPANFLPENLNIWGSIENGDGAYTGQNPQNYFFMNPKVQEVCYITYAEWNDLGYFTVPEGSGFDGGFQIGWAYSPSVTLRNGQIYSFHAVINRNDKEYGPNNPITTKDGLPISEHISVLPVDLRGDGNIITAINTVETGNGEVKSVKYVNVAGMVSDVPFQGVNIVVTEYTDGSRTTTKMLRK